MNRISLAAVAAMLGMGSMGSDARPFVVENFTGEDNARAMASANYAGLGSAAASRVCFGNQRRLRKRRAWARSNGRK